MIRDPALTLRGVVCRRSLYNTKVNGTLPTEIGMLTALTTLSIHNNFIVGQFPSEIGLCTGLRHMCVHSLAPPPCPRSLRGARATY